MSLHQDKHLLSLALIAAMGLSGSAFAQSTVPPEQSAEEKAATGGRVN